MTYSQSSPPSAETAPPEAEASEESASPWRRDLADCLSYLSRRIEEALNALLPPMTDHPNAAGPYGVCPARLAHAARYSTLGGGKLLRPKLTLLAAEAVGGVNEIENALAAACAVELIHAYSLVHDDLPAMDDDELRRGRPTTHVEFDEATAILAGDGLLTLAFGAVADGVRPADRAAACVGILAEAAGFRGMVGGQMADLQAESIPREHGSVELLEAIHLRKTGALLRASLKVGAVASGADASITAALDDYGRALGLAFQIQDDLLDATGDPTKTGKKVGKDWDLGKWTYPAFLGVEESRRRARSLVDQAVTALRPLGDRSARLVGLARTLLERDR